MISLHRLVPLGRCGKRFVEPSLTFPHFFIFAFLICTAGRMLLFNVGTLCRRVQVNSQKSKKRALTLFLSCFSLGRQSTSS